MENKILKISTQTGGIFDDCSADFQYLNKCYKHLSDCGFEAVDFNIDHFLSGADIRKGEVNGFWDKNLDELYEYFSHSKKAAEDNGISFSQIHAPFPLYVDGNDKVNEYMIMVMEKTLAVAAYLNCPAVVAHPFSSEDKKKEKAVNLEMYRKMIPAAKKFGVKICLENMFMTFNEKPIEGSCATADETCWYIDKLNAEAGEDIFGYCFDIGHATLTARNIKNFITTLGHRLTCLHIHDNDGSYDMHMMPYSQKRDWGKLDCTDWNGMIEGLKEINYQGNLSFEAFKGVVAYPEEIRGEALKLLSAIGRYFRNRILND